MIQFASLSKAGGRAVNEDAVAVCEGDGRLLCVLCDGLGGHGDGEVASALAVKAAREVFGQKGVADNGLLPLCLTEAQNALLAEQQATGKPDELKTTAALLSICENTARWAHVGDSRVYLFRKDRMALRTLDHSVPQMLVSQGEIREKDIRFHEDRNRLIRVLGMEWEKPRFELSAELALAPPMSFLLCSDGFWELIEEKEMARALRKSAAPADWLASMEQSVLQNGKGRKMDNYSAVAVFVR